MKVRFARDAEADLEEIGDYIAEHNPLRAETFVQEIRARGHSLSSFASRYPPVERYGSLNIRRANHGRYGIFYRVADNSVVILRVVHSSRGLDTLFGTENN